MSMEGRLELALEELIRGVQVHSFEPRGHETTSDRETCAKCGHNFRDLTQHIRAEEGHPSDVLAEALRDAKKVLAECGRTWPSV